MLLRTVDEYLSVTFEEESKILSNVSQEIADYYNLVIDNQINFQDDLQHIFDFPLVKVTSAIVFSACLIIGIPFHSLFIQYELVEYDPLKRSLFNRIVTQLNACCILNCICAVPNVAWRFSIGPLSHSWAKLTINILIFCTNWTGLSIAEALAVRAANLISFKHLSGINDVFFNIYLLIVNICLSLGICLANSTYGKSNNLMTLFPGNKGKYLQEPNILLPITLVFPSLVIVGSIGIIVYKKGQNNMFFASKNNIQVLNPPLIHLNVMRRNPAIISILPLALTGLSLAIAMIYTAVYIVSILEQTQLDDQGYLVGVSMIFTFETLYLLWLPLLVLSTMKKVRKFMIKKLF